VPTAWLRGIGTLVLAATLAAVPAAAQGPPVGPPGPFVVDLRLATSGLPTDVGFYPPVTAPIAVASRGFGGDIGAHMYAFRLGAARLGFGASFFRVEGRGDAPTASTGTTTPLESDDVVETVETSATLTSVLPQVSFNFGTRDGWSYISGGLGFSQVRTTADPAPGDTTRDSDWTSVLHVGGGARWFIRQRLAVGFDFRIHRLSSRGGSGDAPGSPGALFTSLSAGVSIR
jgi:hypothetical protein